MTQRQRIERTIFYLRSAETLFLTANDAGSFAEIRQLIQDLERERQNLKDGEKAS